MRPIRLAVLVAPALLAALLLAPSTRAQPPVDFIDDPPTYLTAGIFPASVAVGDFNGDHDPDLAVANQVSGEISVLRGIAGTGFAGPTIVGSDPVDPVSDPVSVAVGDFNQDADPDLAVAEQSPGQVRVLLGGAGDSFATATGLLHLAIAAFNVIH